NSVVHPIMDPAALIDVGTVGSITEKVKERRPGLLPLDHIRVSRTAEQIGIEAAHMRDDGAVLDILPVRIARQSGIVAIPVNPVLVHWKSRISGGGARKRVSGVADIGEKRQGNLLDVIHAGSLSCFVFGFR